MKSMAKGMKQFASNLFGNKRDRDARDKKAIMPSQSEDDESPEEEKTRPRDRNTVRDKLPPPRTRPSPDRPPIPLGRPGCRSTEAEGDGARARVTVARAGGTDGRRGTRRRRN